MRNKGTEGGWQPKPGDRVIRPPRVKRFHLRRVLGVTALFSAGYGNVGSSIYYALGIVALAALGATPIVLAIAGVLFIFTALTYAEGTALFPEAGGSASFARHSFNDMTGFVAGWALMLSYIVTISISAFAIPPYLGYFWEPLKGNPVIGATTSIVIILFLMYINIHGVRESSRINITAALVDIATQLSLIVIGFFLIFAVNPGNLVQNMFGAGNWPATESLIFGIAVAALAYTGVETVSQMAEETRHPEVRAPRALILMIFTVLIMFAGISIVALSAMSPHELGDPVNGWARDPLAGIAHYLPSATLAAIYKPLVGILAATILLIATNAGVMGISRLAFSMSTHHEMPSAFGRIHHAFRTPYISIVVFCVVAMLILIPGFFGEQFFVNLGALYAFGSLLAFAFAHASILNLRIKHPRKNRPFKLGWNVRIKKRELPVTALLGLVATAAIWIIIVVVQPYSRWVGFGWMLVGLLMYIFYRWRQRLSLTQTPKS